MNTDLIVQYKKKPTTSSSSSRNEDWLRLEQEKIPDTYDEVGIRDIYNMLSNVLKGESAKVYVNDICPYLKIVDGVVFVTLVFYVWPCNQTMDYELTSDFGTIEERGAHIESVSFDTIFDGTDYAFLNYDMMGTTFTSSMPIFNTEGSVVGIFPPTIENGYAYLEQKVHTVYLTSGMALGKEYVIKMEFNKVDIELGEVSITDIKNNIFASWLDSEGETKTATLNLEIPGCVETLLEACSEGLLSDRLNVDDGKPRLQVYYNRCNGQKLGEKWIEKDE